MREAIQMPESAHVLVFEENAGFLPDEIPTGRVLLEMFDAKIAQALQIG